MVIEDIMKIRLFHRERDTSTNIESEENFPTYYAFHSVCRKVGKYFKSIRLNGAFELFMNNFHERRIEKSSCSRRKEEKLSEDLEQMAQIIETKVGN